MPFFKTKDYFQCKRRNLVHQVKIEFPIDYFVVLLKFNICQLTSDVTLATFFSIAAYIVRGQEIMSFLCLAYSVVQFDRWTSNASITQQFEFITLLHFFYVSLSESRIPWTPYAFVNKLASHVIAIDSHSPHFCLLERIQIDIIRQRR